MKESTLRKNAELLLLSLSSPLKIGIYTDGKLQKSIEDSGMCSDRLAPLYADIIQEWDVQKIYYAKGPGSFMAIKLTYVFLRALQIAKDIEIYASDAFAFNGNTPIKAHGKFYFVKKNATIALQKFEEDIAASFTLPKVLDYSLFDSDIEPLYILPAVR